MPAASFALFYGFILTGLKTIFYNIENGKQAKVRRRLSLSGLRTDAEVVLGLELKQELSEVNLRV